MSTHGEDGSHDSVSVDSPRATTTDDIKEQLAEITGCIDRLIKEKQKFETHLRDERTSQTDHRRTGNVEGYAQGTEYDHSLKDSGSFRTSTWRRLHLRQLTRPTRQRRSFPRTFPGSVAVKLPSATRRVFSKNSSSP